MTITKLIVGGFKSLKQPVEIPLAPITLVFGPNSAGKSAINEALLELKRRLSLDKAESDLFAAVRRFLSQDPVAHQLPRVDELDEATFTRVLLGCEVDDFTMNGSAELLTSSRWSEIGRDLFDSLSGRSVRYLLVDEGGDWACAHELAVDGSTVLTYAASDIAGAENPLPPLADLQGFHGLGGRVERDLGLLSLHVDHPFWKDAEFHSLVDRLRDAVTHSAGDWARSAIRWDDKVLSVRMSAFRRQTHDWAELISDRYGTSPKLPDDIAIVNEPLAALSGGSMPFGVELDFTPGAS